MDTVRLTTAQALVRWLLAQRIDLDGVEVGVFAGVYGIFGHGNVTSLAEALEPVQDRLPTWRGQNEQSMALAGVAYAKAKLRRQIMIATTSVGPGSSNLLTAAAVAHVNRIPLLMLCGDYFAHRAVDPVLQQIETFSDPTVSVCDAFKPVVRYWDRITRPEQIIRSLPQALATMLDPADCGPAFFALPQDVQAEAFDFPVTFFDPKVHYIRRQAADARDISSAAALLSQAKRPLIISGGGVRYSGANSALADFAARRGIPIAETAAGKACVTADNPNLVGTVGIIGSASANKVAEAADVVLAVGTRLQDFTTGSWSLFRDPEVRFILVNTNRWDALKRTDCAVIGDALLSIQSLDEEIGAYKADPEWMLSALRHNSEWASYLEGWRKRDDLDIPSYGQVIQAVNSLATSHDYVVCAAGGIVGELAMAWKSLAPNSFDAEWGFSTMGYEIAGAWGASMAMSDRARHAGGEVLAFVGDGSYLMANSDVFSSVLSGHKVIFIVCDNGGFAVINRLQVNTGGAEFNNLLESSRRAHDVRVDFVQHLTSMGAGAELVSSLSDLPAAFERARASDRSYGLVIPTQARTWLDGSAWWEVGIPEVSVRPEVRVARGELEAEKKHQRWV
jgi:3D-(3,5/4)-trihydroxycyclohexane-1,2-dione acylhydrolase (decyclizing)